MKVAIISESPADQAAVHIFVNALLRQTVELHERRVPPSGWSGVFKVLSATVRELHFNAPDVDGLVVVVDSDTTMPHHTDHDQAGGADLACRLCRLRQEVQRVRSRLPEIGRKPFGVALGVAVPCIEAWFRCGHDRTVTEAAWSIALRNNRFPFDCRRLKKAVYGTDQPSPTVERDRMIVEATRLSADLSVLETWFPNGFGPFAAAVRGWLPPTGSS